ncbi:hypothetical protein [Bradyrhizobium sp. JYMT SZCCT0180]|uniref:hypothetical protein n=1 Tax=Bradyrhizobium sp. JYMT SZCCT0180 TaxID=2807666 RepID=UPI001BABF56F|nr:hypothetical protein [Bradyrhizobium sp. JYMT SZCCT0180]MBR1215581.1 hypothetical protein [Bradyrhizobium sp. JYMT SZCCT0180]
MTVKLRTDEIGTQCPPEAALILVRELRDLPRSVPQLYIMAVNEPLGALFGGVITIEFDLNAINDMVVRTDQESAVNVLHVIPARESVLESRAG